MLPAPLSLCAGHVSSPAEQVYNPIQPTIGIQCPFNPFLLKLTRFCNPAHFMHRSRRAALLLGVADVIAVQDASRSDLHDKRADARSSLLQLNFLSISCAAVAGNASNVAICSKSGFYCTI
jgi:hypothetical protein